MANVYRMMDDAELQATKDALDHEAEVLASKLLRLDMARGKPNKDQINLSRPMLDILASDSDLTDDGVDASNYGVSDGLPTARKLGADLLGVPYEQVIVENSASLEIMYNIISAIWSHGISGEKPWSEQGQLKFLCPVPGYDRHFAITEHFGFENVPVAMNDDGPDMDEVCRMVETDASVKGIWCVPKYANPTGITYSDEVVRRFAALKPAAPDFRIFWDNAYIVHHLYDEGDELTNIFDVIDSNGDDTERDGLVFEFASTSKLTFPGSGISWLASSMVDRAWYERSLALRRVCPNKMVQLAHVRFLPDVDAVSQHMKKHAELLRPRFELVEKRLSEALGELGIATWTHPRGGYFVSFEGPEGSAQAIVRAAAELGVTLTGAGATWPSGNDPHDSNIRIAPTYPSLDELDAALEVFVLCVKMVALRLELERRG
ncbi:MAG: aminotransferase [Atopobiaceae bacterium]|nr:aminotransferase [Atopobiaceae bacterium]